MEEKLITVKIKWMNMNILKMKKILFQRHKIFKIYNRMIYKIINKRIINKRIINKRIFYKKNIMIIINNYNHNFKHNY